MTTPELPDGYHYGWRYVRRRSPDGREILDEVPLTLEDVLHPQEEDFIPEDTRHEPERNYLTCSFRAHVDRIPSGQILSNCLLDFNVASVRPLCPDVSVIEGVNTLPLPQISTYRFAVFGGRCLVVVEITSLHTRTNDVDLKPDLYHRGGVQQYVLIDQQRQDGPRQIVSRRWTPVGYVIEPPDAAGRIRLDDLGLLLGLRNNRVVVFDATTGDELREYAEEYAARRAAEEDASREGSARKRAEDRVRELEEELRRVRGTPPP